MHEDAAPAAAVAPRRVWSYRVVDLSAVRVRLYGDGGEVVVILTRISAPDGRPTDQQRARLDRESPSRAPDDRRAGAAHILGRWVTPTVNPDIPAPAIVFPSDERWAHRAGLHQHRRTVVAGRDGRLVLVAGGARTLKACGERTGRSNL